ncbi:Uncharacterized membrane protein YckC, RDD family [Halobacillus dabanensis]|uniref:Uncharacterized membrane protein YckC, RDD family n=1 Tax=Halobacillus dabanensis TaxID=240302 RepID=A0A1I3TKM6_HALDA|nr:RDD family protein [Halobacillus dabanensis]SFJ70171.1 Uncharacterized membrane protein YckC, RDD family [Halobacillus dabanensis]
MEVQNPAGFWNRLGGRLIDAVIVTVILGIIFWIVYGEFLRDGSSIFDTLGVAYTVIVPVLWSGYTIGRKLVGNRIVRKDHRNVGIGKMLLREVVSAFIYAFSLGIALIVSAFMVGIREDKRAIHDFIAGTYVTHNPPGKM